MEVVPVINCLDKTCIQERWEGLRTIDAHAVHFDVADGVFAPVVSPLTPQLLRELLDEHPGVSVEVHLMVRDPDAVIEAWLEAGVKRVIVHIEAVHDLPYLIRVTQEYGATLILGVSEKTDIRKLVPYLETYGVREVHLLEVSPGFSGQGMNPKAMDRISFLRAAISDVVITVDGGITSETAIKMREAGVARVVSSSFIWESANPRESFELLKKIGDEN